VRIDLRKLSLLLLLAAPAAAHAQLWSGPAAVEVHADDEKGHDLAGAHVLLQYTSLNPKDGPRSVETDTRGRVNVSGLAEGSWHLEVSHDGFMTYIAEIQVRQKGRPELVDATQLRVAGGTSLMKVKISRGTPGPAPIRSNIPVPPAQPMVPREPVTPPPPAAQPAPAPMAPATPPAPRPEPKAQPAPEPPKQKTPAPVVPKPIPPTPKPAPMQSPPAPAPMPAQPPVSAPAPPPVAPPVDAVRIRTAKDRTCVECQPGETALSTEWVIPAGSGSCGADIATKLKGGIPADLPAGCHVLRIALPAGAKYTAYRYEAQDGTDSLDCPTAKDCPNNIGRWPGDPILVRSPQGTVVLAPFESGPGGEGRRVVLTVYYSTGRK
jgi:hypothetical protein